MSTQSRYFANNPSVANRPTSFVRLKTIIKENPIKLFLVVFVLAAAAIGYYAAATTYACVTKTIDNSQSCHKYRISPQPVKYLGKVSNTACPVNPPSNCP